MKYKIILISSVVIAAVLGACLGEFFGNLDSSLLAWLGFHKSFGFDEITLDIVFFRMTLSMNFDVYLIQAFLLALAVRLAPKLNASIQF